MTSDHHHYPQLNGCSQRVIFSPDLLFLVFILLLHNDFALFYCQCNAIESRDKFCCKIFSTTFIPVWSVTFLFTHVCVERCSAANKISRSAPSVYFRSIKTPRLSNRIALNHIPLYLAVLVVSGSPYLSLLYVTRLPLQVPKYTYTIFMAVLGHNYNIATI